jgi:hypothetical protein
MSSALKTPVGENISPLAGRPAPRETLMDRARLEREYFERRREPSRSSNRGTISWA